MTANYSTREYREKLYDDLHVRLRDTAILMCAIFIASIGLNMNSTAVIIGAMLISPLMTPIVGDPISEEELETLHQKQASYGIQSVQLKVNQVNNSQKLDSEMTKEFYENIDKYIDQKLSEKDSQNDLVKENEADKD